MPFVVQKKGDKWCVWTQGTDGEPKGDPHGCHDTEEMAKKQQAALYVNVPETRFVKMFEGSETEIEGLAMPFGGPFDGQDVAGEHFSAKTDFAFNWFKERPLLYHHGLDGDVQMSVVGRVKSWDVRADLGVWMKGQLDASNEYFAAIKELIKKGKLFLSAGAMRHLVEVDKKTGEIKRWPWVEESLTPTPANLFAEVDFATAREHYEAAGIKAMFDEFDGPKWAEAKAIWTTAEVNELPDACFALIEDGGEKDEEGKTKPRSLRHFPYKDKDGTPDEAHIRNALARIPQSILPQDAKDKALAVIQRAAKQVGIEVGKAANLLRLLTDNDGDLLTALNDVPLTTHADIVISLATALGERTKGVHERRLKEGRVLSEASKRRFKEAIGVLMAAVKDMSDFLDSTEPQSAKAASVRQRVDVVIRDLARYKIATI